MKALRLTALLALAAALTFAQAPTATQQSGTRLDAATTSGTSASTGATITITPPGGQYFYLVAIDITNCAGSSAVTAASVTSVTTTNITGGPAWTIGSGVAAGLCQPTIALSWANGLKSTTAGTASTFVLPTFATNQTVRVNVYGYFAP